MAVISDKTKALVAGVAAEAKRIETPCGDGSLVWRVWGSGPPLVLLHGGYGSWMHWIRNVPVLSRQFTVIAPDLPGLGDSATPPEPWTAEGLAAIVVSGLDIVLPKGVQPHMAGFSFGGRVALEMARSLGEKDIALLLMIDSYALPRTWPLKSRVTRSARVWLNRVRLLATRSPRETAKSLIDRFARLAHRNSAPGTATQPNPARQWLGEPDANLPLALRQVQDAGGIALLSYVPKPYDGKITFIKAETAQVVFPTDPANVWSRVGRAFELHTAPGDHASMIHRHADHVADCVSACLARAGLPENANAG